MQKRRFTKEFEAEAVRLVQTSGRTQREVADDLGIGLSTLVRWVGRSRDRLIDEPPKPGSEDVAADIGNSPLFRGKSKANRLARQSWMGLAISTTECAETSLVEISLGSATDQNCQLLWHLSMLKDLGFGVRPEIFRTSIFTRSG